jgi:hypothetical protein
MMALETSSPRTFVGSTLQPRPPTGIGPEPPIRGDEPEPEATNTSRRARARGLIAMSAIAITLAGIAYLSPSWTAKPQTHLLKAAPTPLTAPVAIGPLVRTFTSPKMQFSARYPAAWKVTPSTTSWRTKGARWTDPEADLLDGRFVNFWGTSQALERGQSAKAWLDRYVQYLASVGTAKCGVQEHVAVADHASLIIMNGCNSEDLPGRVYDVVFVAGGRGYDLSMEGEVDHPYFLAMLATVQLQS